MEESIIINTASEFDSIRVSDFDNEVWLNVITRNASCHVTLTPTQANDLIMALQTAVAVALEAA